MDPALMLWFGNGVPFVTYICEIKPIIYFHSAKWPYENCIEPYGFNASSMPHHHPLNMILLTQFYNATLILDLLFMSSNLTFHL
jgi:hypothetical protein